MVSATDDIDTGRQADGIVVSLVNLAAVCVVNFQSQILRVVQVPSITEIFVSSVI